MQVHTVRSADQVRTIQDTMCLTAVWLNLSIQTLARTAKMQDSMQSIQQKVKDLQVDWRDPQGAQTVELATDYIQALETYNNYLKTDLNHMLNVTEDRDQLRQQLSDVQAENEYETFFYAVADQWVSMYFADGDRCEGCNYFVPGPGGPDPTYCKCLDGGDPSECPAFEDYFDELMRPYKRQESHRQS